VNTTLADRAGDGGADREGAAGDHAGRHGASTSVRTTACAVCEKEKRCAAAAHEAERATAPSSVTPVPSAVPARTGSSAMASAAWRMTRSPGIRLPATGAK
jgi:hypothetical protein